MAEVEKIRERDHGFRISATLECIPLQLQRPIASLRRKASGRIVAQIGLNSAQIAGAGNSQPTLHFGVGRHLSRLREFLSQLEFVFPLSRYKTFFSQAYGMFPRICGEHKAAAVGGLTLRPA